MCDNTHNRLYVTYNITWLSSQFRSGLIILIVVLIIENSGEKASSGTSLPLNFMSLSKWSVLRKRAAALESDASINISGEGNFLNFASYHDS